MYGGVSYPTPLSQTTVVVPTEGRAAKPPVPLSRGTLFPVRLRSHSTAGRINGGKRVGHACRDRRGKGGRRVDAQRRLPALSAACLADDFDRQGFGLRMPERIAREVR